MPTPPKPPSLNDASQLTLGLFRWLSKNGHSKAPNALRAKPEVMAALAAKRLDQLASTIATAFLQALDTWIHLKAPQFNKKYSKAGAQKKVAAIQQFTEDDELRTKALRLLGRFPAAEFTALIERIATIDAMRMRRNPASPAKRNPARSNWLKDAELLEALIEQLKNRLHAPLGVVFPRTLREWTAFEQEFIEKLQNLGFSYRELTELLNPKVSTKGLADDNFRTQRERIRSSARRAKTNKD